MRSSNQIMVRFNQRQRTYLSSPWLQQVLAATDILPILSLSTSKVFYMKRLEAEFLREQLMNRMDFAGFDDEYEPTAEGKVLEELIDLLGVSLGICK